MLQFFKSDPSFLITLAMLLATFLVAFIATVFLIPLVKWLAFRIGFLDYPGGRKTHPNPMPLGGGVAIFMGVLISVTFAILSKEQLSQAFSLLCEDHLSNKYVAPDELAFSKDILLILGGGAIIFILGLVDDVVKLKPWPKIIVESIVGLTLFLGDIRITLFIDNPIFSAVTTILWLLLITNSFNLLDNMDGLSAGVAFISGGIFFLVAIQTQQWFIAFLLFSFLGSLLGFLKYNFPPASIFMGDSGSLFIGYMMAVLTLRFTFYRPPYPLFPVILAPLVLAVPLFDTFTVILIRYKEKRPIFQGDQKHVSHRLVLLGMSKTEAVLVIYLITFSTGITATLLYQVNLIGASIIIIQMLCVLLVIHILERTAGGKLK